MGGKNAAQAKEILPKAKYLKITDGNKEPIRLEKESKPIPLNNPKDNSAINEQRNASPEPSKITIDQAELKIKQAKESDPVPSAPEGQLRPAADTVMGRFGDIIRDASEKYRLSPDLLESIIKAESAGNPGAISSAGAKGLMQLADTTATDMGVKNAFDPKENIHGGAKYLRWLIDTFGDLKKALAAYNSGPETVKRYNGIPPYRETRKYVQTVISSLPDGRNYYE